MSDRLTLDTGTGEPVHVKLAEGQDRTSLEEDLMEAARNGTVVTVKGSVKGTSSDTIHINPSNALWWAIDDAPNRASDAFTDIAISWSSCASIRGLTAFMSCSGNNRRYAATPSPSS